MPIRVRVERVGYYEQYPDAVIHDLKIVRTDHFDDGQRAYEVQDRAADGVQIVVWHKEGAGVEALVAKALELIP